MKKNYTLLLFWGIITLLSCKKETSLEIAPVTPEIVGDSIFISKLVALDTTKLAPFDTVYTSTFKYDNLKRVVTNSYFEYNNTGHKDTSSYYFITDKSYNGNDTLPFKQITSIKDGIKSLNVNFYSYETGTAIISTDSLISQDVYPFDPVIYTDVRNYNHIANPILSKRTVYYNNVYSGSGTFMYNVTRKNGDIIDQQDNAWGRNNNFSCAYDTKINPFSKAGTSSFGNPGFIDLVISDSDIDPTNYEQPNNVIEINNISGTNKTHYIYNYRYNSKNYPVQVTLKNLNGTVLFKGINKITYSYTN